MLHLLWKRINDILFVTLLLTAVISCSLLKKIRKPVKRQDTALLDSFNKSKHDTVFKNFQTNFIVLQNDTNSDTDEPETGNIPFHEIKEDVEILAKFQDPKGTIDANSSNRGNFLTTNGEPPSVFIKGAKLISTRKHSPGERRDGISNKEIEDDDYANLTAQSLRHFKGSKDYMDIDSIDIPNHGNIDSIDIPNHGNKENYEDNPNRKLMIEPLLKGSSNSFIQKSANNDQRLDTVMSGTDSANHEVILGKSQDAEQLSSNGLSGDIFDENSIKRISSSKTKVAVPVFATVASNESPGKMHITSNNQYYQEEIGNLNAPWKPQYLYNVPVKLEYANPAYMYLQNNIQEQPQNSDFSMHSATMGYNSVDNPYMQSPYKHLYSAENPLAAIPQESFKTAPFDTSKFTKTGASFSHINTSPSIANWNNKNIDNKIFSINTENPSNENTASFKNPPQKFHSNLKETHATVNKIRVLCIGDSLTSGYYGNRKIYHPYSVMLGYLLNTNIGNEFELITKGVGGEKVHIQMYNRLKTLLVTESPLDLVIILGGLNDLIKLDVHVDIFYDIAALHELCHQNGVSTVSLTIPETHMPLSKHVYRSYNDFLIVWGSVNERVRNYKSNWTVSCDLARQFPLASLSDPEKRAWWSDDYIHPTIAGYDQIGRIIYDCIVAIL